MMMEEPVARGNEAFSPELLKQYYSRLFPFHEMFQWLSYGNDPESSDVGVVKEYFPHREWSFTIAGDIYIRYQSFKSEEEMAAEIQKRQPHKLDIGAVFSTAPKAHHTVKAGSFVPMERELVFDVDLTDYDDVRTCCDGANICTKCWVYMTVAIKVVDRALREDFGFCDLLWVYSGRRGVHCWVCDATARKLTNEARSAVVAYLSLVKGGDGSRKRMELAWPLHPSLQRAYDEVCLPMFERHMVAGPTVTMEGEGDENEGEGGGVTGMGLLESPESWNKLLDLIPDEASRVREALRESWESPSCRLSAYEKWMQLKVSVEEELTSHSSKKMKTQRSSSWAASNALRRCVAEIVFTHTYPRLDENVSKARNHLLKSPFCVHPKTGRVCVPIDPAKCDDFNPLHAPTVGLLLEQINRYDEEEMKQNPEEEGAGGSLRDASKTEMQSVLDVFNNGFLHPLLAREAQNRKKLRTRNAPSTGDW